MSPVPADPLQSLGSDASEPGFHTTGDLTVAFVLYRGMTIAAAHPGGEAPALAALRQKVASHRDRLRATEAIPAVHEVNLVADHGVPGSQPQRRFVRPMTIERARFELALGVDGALVFLDSTKGALAVATRGEHEEPQLLRVGDPVLGDDAERPAPRPGRTPPATVETELRRTKAARVRSLLRCPDCHGDLVDQPDRLQCARCARTYPVIDGRPLFAAAGYDPTPRAGNELGNPYGQQCLELIEQFRDGLVLDCGSGQPSRGFYNVVHLELFAFPEVDVVTDGGPMPFADDTFDAVLSEAVLEHVSDPVGYLRDVARVLKPGGIVRADAAFLQPYHGYPDHYFNMTRSGLSLVLERAGLEIVSIEPGLHQMPAVALSLLLNGYVAGTGDDERRRRILNMTIGEAIETLAAGTRPPFDGLARTAVDKLAAGFSCLARKPSSC